MLSNLTEGKRISFCGDHNYSLPLPFGVIGKDPGALPEGIMVKSELGSLTWLVWVGYIDISR